MIIRLPLYDFTGRKAVDPPGIHDGGVNPDNVDMIMAVQVPGTKKGTEGTTVIFRGGNACSTPLSLAQLCNVLGSPPDAAPDDEDH